MYIYIYIYTCVYISLSLHIYIYIYVILGALRALQGGLAHAPRTHAFRGVAEHRDQVRGEGLRVHDGFGLPGPGSSGLPTASDI